MTALHRRLLALETAGKVPLPPLPALVIHPGQDAEAERAAFNALHGRPPAICIQVKLVHPRPREE